MAIDKGNIKTSANYDVKAQKPLDGRAVRPAKADLIKKESWSSDGSTVYVYEGMQVYVQDEKKTYYLKDLSKMFATDFSGWELMGTGAAAEIEVDTELSDTSENAIANSTVSRALAGKQERLMDGVNIKTINGQNILGRGNITIEGGGGGGITEEKEVYIGSEEPPVGAKVWIDPTGTPSGDGGNSGGSANEPIVLYFAMDDVLSEMQTQSNATNVALLIDAISQGKYGNNFLVGLVASGSVRTLAQPFFYAAFNGMLKVGTSFSAVKESTQFYWVAQRLSFGTDGNVTIE